ncbi:17367_t:CDS:2, partial [Gigaspora rosea]
NITLTDVKPNREGGFSLWDRRWCFIWVTWVQRVCCREIVVDSSWSRESLHGVFQGASPSSIQEAFKNAAFWDIVISVAWTYYIFFHPLFIVNHGTYNTNTGNLNGVPEDDKATIKINVIEEEDQ